MQANLNAYKSPPRNQWPRFIQAVSVEKTLALAKSFGAKYRIEDIQRPESGLALIKNRDGACGEEYFLGETPVSRAHLRIFQGNELVGEGGAQILDDRSDLARAIAIIDAVVANQLQGYEEACKLLQEGEAQIKQQQEQRSSLLSRTLVDFSLLGNDEG